MSKKIGKDPIKKVGQADVLRDRRIEQERRSLDREIKFAERTGQDQRTIDFLKSLKK